MKKPIVPPAVLQKRSIWSTFEYQKRLTYLAIGTLILDFLVVTREVDPALTSLQTVTLLLGVTTMSIEAIYGILGWHAFERRIAILSDDREIVREIEGQDFISLFKYWYFRQSIFEMWLKYLFGMGLIFAIALMFERYFKL